MTKNSLVLYRSFLAIIEDRDGDKYQIKFCTQMASAGGKKAQYGSQKVREKDIVLLHEGPCSSLDKALLFSDDAMKNQINEAYELLQSDESTATAPLPLSELAEYSRGEFKADEAWAFYNELCKDPHFALSQEELKNGKIIFIPRTQEEINLLNQKQYEKEHEEEIRNAFIQRLRNKKLDLPSDSKFMGEVEAFALCKTDKSKIMKEAGISQTIEKAHKLLIECGIWDVTKNPYPTRLGFSFESAKEGLGAMPEEERLDVPVVAYAIDSEHSTDPDDAVAFEPLSKAYGIPKDDPSRDEIMEKCLKDAAMVPFKILELACKAIDLQKDFADKGSVIMISDAATGVAMLEGAVKGSAINVKINTKSMKDRTYADQLDAKVKNLVDEYTKRAEEVYKSVLDRI